MSNAAVLKSLDLALQSFVSAMGIAADTDGADILVEQDFGIVGRRISSGGKCRRHNP